MTASVLSFINTCQPKHLNTQALQHHKLLPVDQSYYGHIPNQVADENTTFSFLSVYPVPSTGVCGLDVAIRL